MLQIGSPIPLVSGALGVGALAGYGALKTANNPEDLQFQSITLLVVSESYDTGLNDGQLIVRSMGSAVPSWALGTHRGSSDGWVVKVNGTGGDVDAVWSRVDDEARKPVAQVLTIAGGNAALFVNGENQRTYNYVGDLNYSRTDTPIAVLTTHKLALTTFRGVCYCVAIIEGALCDEQAMSLSANPWQLFRADPVRIYSLPSGGTSLIEPTVDGYASAEGAASIASTVALSGVGVALSSGTAGLGANTSASAGGAATATGSAFASTDIALSAIGLAVSIGSGVLAGASHSTLQAEGGASAGGSATVTANITISAAGLARAAGVAGMSAAQLLAGAGAAQAAGNSALAAEISAIAAGVAQATGSADLGGGVAGAVDAVGQVTASGSAALILTVRLTATGTANGAGGAALEAGAGVDMTAAGAASGAGSADITTEVQITAAGFAQAIGAGFIVLQVPILATGAGLASGAAALTSGAALVLIANPLFTVHSSGQLYQVEAPARRYQVGRS